MSRAFLRFGTSMVPLCLVAIATLLAIGCGGDETDQSRSDSGPGKSDDLDATSGPGWRIAPALPVAIANNAVAAASRGTGCTLFSFLGIGGGFQSSDIVSSALAWSEGEASWRTLEPTPGPARVAASAVTLDGNVYVVGGYTVAPNGAEASVDRLDMFNLASQMWEAKPPLPIAIDDSVVLAWRDQYIVVVSGWSDIANVADVQIYDSEKEKWMVGTSFPGTAVFGHAGGISGDTLLIVDGAASTAGFPLTEQTWRGDLDPSNPETIVWTDLGSHPGNGRYRAAGGSGAPGEIWIHGGTSTPYNFDGLRYDNGQAAEPLADTLVFKVADNSMGLAPTVKLAPTMDHRSLVSCSNRSYTIGGMIAGPFATTNVSYSL